MKYQPLPNDPHRVEGLRPVGVCLDSLVKSLRVPLPKVAPRKLEKAKA